jgi:hypothetical protein
MFTLSCQEVIGIPRLTRIPQRDQKQALIKSKSEFITLYYNNTELYKCFAVVFPTEQMHDNNETQKRPLLSNKPVNTGKCNTSSQEPAFVQIIELTDTNTSMQA